MRTIMKSLLQALIPISMCVATATGHAEPGAGPGEESEAHRLAVLGPTAGKERCASRGGLCLRAGQGTVPALAGLALAAGAPITTQAAPGFVRVQPGESRRGFDPDALPWTVEVSANLSHPAVPGNALFILRDVEDPDQAVATRVVTALWQAAIPGGDGLALKLSLGVDDGFRSGHTYELRIVQLIAGQEVELAAGEVRLM